MKDKHPPQKVTLSKKKKKREYTDLSYVYWQRLANGELTEGFTLADHGKLTLIIPSKWDKARHRVELRKSLKRLYDNSTEFRNIFKTPLLKANQPFLELRNYKRPSNKAESTEFLKKLHDKLIEIAQTEPLYDFKALFYNGQLIDGYHLVAKKIILKIAAPYNNKEHYHQINQMLQNYYFKHKKTLEKLFCCPKMSNQAPSLVLRDVITLTDITVIAQIEKILKLRSPKEQLNGPPTITTNSTREPKEQHDLSQIDDLPELLEDFLFSYKLNRKKDPILTLIQIEALRSLPSEIVELLYSPDYLSEPTEGLVTTVRQSKA